MSVVLEDESELLRNMQKLAGFNEVAGPHIEKAMRIATKMGEQKVISELVALANENRSAMTSEIGGDFTPLAPVNPKTPSGKIQGFVQVDGPMDVTGVVGDRSKKYLRMTEAGRGPGKHPPARALQDWAERVLGVVPAPVRVTKKGREIRDVSVGRALSKAIAEKGVRGSPVMAKSEEAVRAHVMGLFEAELLKIAAELGFK